jgi:phage baseplate assembly protein V
MMREIGKLLAPLQRRVRLMVSRGVLSLVDDAPRVQKVQVKLLAGEVRDGLERVQQYGFSSVPAAGSEAVVLFVSGNRDHGIVIGTENRAQRRTGLKEGEVALYTGADSNGGHRILLTQDRGVEIHGQDGLIKVKTLRIEAEEAVMIYAPAITLEADTVTVRADVSIEGDLSVDGDISASGSIVDEAGNSNHHTHP